ncbi:leucyl/phenylalanyl-tRNA--protein transferase [Thalassotalea ponticola]|uniref:leucyl/phenylalanyl-tRNA--protein transferase n=1 Tax=Thalassotalea ponticola TaxID=1523392 RepID=UPI0025B43EED|nr:leucyl/phenylalanyl-tRNA--protein transferase [Thalassotalea ponticola]MDN3651448.1 leucyl/phenylalanyl-tRNA--protein transferase [Thalassotalea ponticola]
MSQSLYSLDDKVLAFPHHHLALSEPNGLLAVGGDLSPDRLTLAYRHGIFPWFNEGDPILWWSPDPRAILPTEHVYTNRSLLKFIKKCDYRVTLNKAFVDVIAYCANAPTRDDDTWILSDMIQAYSRLHKLGMAHSIEVWQNDQLVGGLYGVAINGFFSGESMFYLRPNASKIALLALTKKLKHAGINFVDCQILNPFLQSMGAIELSRCDFLMRQQDVVSQRVADHFWHASDLSFR